MLVTEYQLKITFTDKLLGTVAYNKEVYSTFVQAKAREVGVPEEQLAEEVLDVKNIEEKGWTGFFQDETGIYISSHMVKGFLKNASLVIKDQTKVKNAKSKVNNFVFLKEKKLYLMREKISGETEIGHKRYDILSKSDGVLERPLQAMTLQGPRVSLAKSDYVDEGTCVVCTLRLLQNPEISEKLIREFLDYGQFLGLGQWRNSGKGQFEYELSKIS